MKTVLKSVAGGIALGAILFFAGPLIFIVLLLKFIFTPFGMGRMMYARHMAYGGHFMGGTHFADKVRNMSEEEYTNFKAAMQNRHYGCWANKTNINH